MAAKNDGELRAWSSDRVRVSCPGCASVQRASVLIGLRGNVAGRRWLAFERHMAACGRPCVTGGVMGNVSSVDEFHKGPASCVCGIGLLDYERPAGIALEGAEGKGLNDESS